MRNSGSVENERAKSASGSVLVYCERCDKQIQDGIKGEGLTKNKIAQQMRDDKLRHPELVSGSKARDAETSSA